MLDPCIDITLSLISEHVANKYQLSSTLFDWAIASSAARVLSLNDGVVSICGTASSLIGIANILMFSQKGMTKLT